MIGIFGRTKRAVRITHAEQQLRAVDEHLDETALRVNTTISTIIASRMRLQTFVEEQSSASQKQTA